MITTMLKKYKNLLFIVLALCVIVLSFIGFLFFDLDSNMMYMICIVDIVVVALLLYIHNYKDHHYGGKFKKDFPDAH